jgi:hypothetical protein
MSRHLLGDRLLREHARLLPSVADACRTTAAVLMSALAIIGCFVLPFGASAQETGSPPMVTDRPDATESAITVARGVFQLESGYTFGGVEGIRVHNLGEVLLRVGVADMLELRFGVNSYQWVRAPSASARGLQDSTIGVKLKLIDNGGKTGLGSPQVAVLASTSLPTGSSLVSQDKLQPEMRVSVAWDLSERLALGTNVFYVYGNDVIEDERFHQAGATLSLGIGLTDRWGAYAEYFGNYTVVRDGPREDYVNGGVTFLVGRDLQLDGRVGYGLNDLDDDFFVGFGSSVRW